MGLTERLAQKRLTLLDSEDINNRTQPDSRNKTQQTHGTFIKTTFFITQGMEIVQTMNSDPGLAVGETNFRSIKCH